MMRTFLSLLLMVLLGGCISPRPWLAVSMRGLPGQSHSLRVMLHPVGKAETSEQHLDRRSGDQTLELDVPLDWRSSPLSLDVTVLDTNGCEVSQGHTQLDVPSSARLPEPARVRQHLLRRWSRWRAWRPIVASVDLIAFPARCPVSIVSTGDVPLHVEVGGSPVQCPRGTSCELALVPGTNVRVRAEIDPAVTFWSGPCEQSRGDTCRFAVQEATKLNVSFFRPVCRRGFCWYNPLPQANNLPALWGSSRTDVWAAGGAGTLMHFDGQVWEGVESGTTSFLLGLWGSSPNDVWACGGEGTLLHYDGQQWATVASGTQQTLRGLFGTAANSIWAVGDGGTILRFDGKQWTAMASSVKEDLHGVWSPDGRTAWAVGEKGTLLLFDGEHWQLQPTDTKNTLRSIWGRAPRELWAFVEGGIVRLDGPSSGRDRRWHEGYLVVDRRSVQGWVLEAGGRMWRVGEPQPGSAGASASGPGGILGAWMNGPNDIWVSGQLGRLHHFDGRQWSSVGASFSRSPYFNYVRGRSASDVWTFGALPWHWDGTAWSPRSRDWRHEHPKDWRRYFELSVFGDRPIHFNPNIWFNAPTWFSLSGTWGSQLAWASSSNDVWLLSGSARIYHFDGEDWQVQALPEDKQQHAIWGSGPNDVWIVGNKGLLVHFDGKSWREWPSPSGTTELRDVWGCAQEDVWAVGTEGQLLHFEGQNWEATPSGTRAAFRRIWGMAADDVWVVGSQGTLLHYDGKRWSGALSGVITNWNLHDIWGSSSSDLWIVGEQGILVRRQK